MKKEITEKDGVQKEWYEQASKFDKVISTKQFIDFKKQFFPEIMQNEKSNNRKRRRSKRVVRTGK